MKKILFVAVHPDDETLGCGGTILKSKERGDEIYWLILTKANQKITEIVNIETIQKEYVKKVSDAYDFTKTYHLDFLETELDQYFMIKLIGKIKQIFDEVKPDTVYLPNRSDVHSDHKVAFEAVYACTKNFRAPYIKTILIHKNTLFIVFIILNNNQLAHKLFLILNLIIIKKQLCNIASIRININNFMFME